MNKTIEEAAREAVRKEYLCEKCAWKDDCDLCGGENTAFDCCECSAVSYEDGFKAGAAHLMSLLLASRMTAEEKERVRKIRDMYYSKWREHPNEATEAVYCAIKGTLEPIFGKELFESVDILP